MALSNIWNEPRREITESVVGFISVIGLYIAPGIAFGFWLGPKVADTPGKGNCLETCSIILSSLFLWPLTLAVIAAVSAFLIFGTHSIGESICDALQNRGIRLRPVRASERAAQLAWEEDQRRHEAIRHSAQASIPQEWVAVQSQTTSALPPKLHQW